MPIADPRILVLAGICCVLVVASFAGRLLEGRSHSLKERAFAANWKQRVRAWWVMVALGGSALMAGPLALFALFAGISFLALREFCASQRGGAAMHPLMAAGFYAILPVQYALIALAGTPWSLFFVPVIAAIALPVWMWPQRANRNLLEAGAELGLGWLVCIGCLSYPVILLFADGAGGSLSLSLQVLFLVLVSQAGDVFQFLWGKALGRRLLAPRVSPNKTVGGLAGGLFSGAALGMALSFLTPYPPWQAGALALLVTLAGTAGGLLLSACKRKRGIKDWGDLLPGHGGVLDRVDSLWLSAPLYFFVTNLLASE
ncbi:MAG: phosphatidate cytidylyltransferase [Bryobacterales bacterium]|nr:phosphatidate cytidylyltransferase [Bryobacterales bacterium]